VEIGKNEARKHHEMLLSELREQIRSGTFQADMDVVAERVAEVLGEV
jgi:anti-sigma28 factor (negative regulator of flagellin synthesis)